MIEWCASGGLETRSDFRVANDLVDLSQVAFGTYFDGVLASDARLLRVAGLARFLTNALVMRHEVEPRASICSGLCEKGFVSAGKSSTQLRPLE